MNQSKVVWLFVLSDQSVGNDIFHLKVFLIFHQLLWWGLIRGPNLWKDGVIGLQVFHILEWGESGETWGDFH